MKIGKMRYRVTIQYPSDGVDDYGNSIDTWQDLTTVWADIQPVSGREYLTANQATSETQYKIYIRYIPNINAKMRIVHNEQIYEILAVLGDKRSNMLTIMCKEVV
ncbi:phage head-tail adaptor, putative, SPP1 family [Anaerovibrio lipolyticus DSM 3074]|uniref:Phage head-tail adaptor, putative, SPP1 family n=1 Tax=Anaerovibrio lipolyticus DSM 3074 TaxID=1120997 RepID=A0A1M6G7X4_9FIRM|nr:phage head closure protein [Anaerovibrio lipolyticus]SHJ06014.1 phage head-tail adaptor, putative, SPP1 family [Anaerovibrio lipolyticus DSM 3074]